MQLVQYVSPIDKKTFINKLPGDMHVKTEYKWLQANSLTCSIVSTRWGHSNRKEATCNVEWLQSKMDGKQLLIRSSGVKML